MFSHSSGGGTAIGCVALPTAFGGARRLLRAFRLVTFVQSGVRQVWVRGHVT